MRTPRSEHVLPGKTSLRVTLVIPGSILDCRTNSFPWSGYRTATVRVLVVPFVKCKEALPSWSLQPLRAIATTIATASPRRHCDERLDLARTVEHITLDPDVAGCMHGRRLAFAQSSIRMESRIDCSSARSPAGDPWECSAAIIRRVPSTSRIQNSSR
jgi:hypothetical protein